MFFLRPDSETYNIGGTEAHSFNQKLDIRQSIFVLYFGSNILVLIFSYPNSIVQWNPSFNSQGKRLTKSNYCLSYGR